MSCAANKSNVVNDWDPNGYSSGSSPIQIYEKTESTNNKATISATKGIVTCSLTISNGLYPSTVYGTAKLYLKISEQANGFSEDGKNDPPVNAHEPAVYENDALETPTLNQNFTSRTYATATPAFSSTNTCGSTTQLGWQMSDAQVVMTRNIIKSAYVKFS